jgi:integrase
MGLADLPAWFEQAAALSNPVRREYHLLTLLSGSRPSALKQARLEHLDLRRRVLHVPCPKGGKRKAFDIPLSREMIRSIVRVQRAGRMMHPDTSQTWLFPADPKSGHLSEHGELRTVLAKYGNDLRQSYRTLAQVAGVSETDAMLLMNHSLPGVNAGYITRQKRLQDHLRRQQEAISTLIMKVARKANPKSPVGKWLSPHGLVNKELDDPKAA